VLVKLSTTLTLVAGLSVAVGSAATAQSGNSIFGTWEAGADSDVREVVIRPDSSVSYGSETVRWRVIGDTIKIALGGEWVCYKHKVKGDELTLSEGDLEKPIKLKLIGPALERPDTIPMPEIPEWDECV
jgi:hypothetical protein